MAVAVTALFGFALLGAQSAAATGAPEHKTEFACNRLALGPQARKRHFDTLGPALRKIHKRVRELPDGFEFEFSPDATTVQMVSEWAAGERLCCPFFDIDLRFQHDSGGFWLRLTGAAGVKQFIETDLATWMSR